MGLLNGAFRPNDNVTRVSLAYSLVQALALQDQALAIDLLPIGELFYRVRFGRGELSPAQEQELNRILTRLEAAAPHSNGQDRTTCNPASNVSDG